MSQEKTQHTNILLAILGFVTVVIIVALIGFFALGRDPELIQGQVEATEYRVSSKVPGRILEHWQFSMHPRYGQKWHRLKEQRVRRLHLN